MRGASSMVKKVRMAMVTMETSVDTAAAPTEKAVAGWSTLVICEVIFVEPSERYLLQVQAEDESAQWPVALLGLADQRGNLLAEVHGGGHERLREQVDQADERNHADEEDDERRPAVGHPPPAEKTCRRGQQERDEERDDGIDDDGAQRPEADDECDVEVEQPGSRPPP